MAGESYEGWTNRETWLVNLWLNNDEVIYRIMQNADLSTAERAKKFYFNIVPQEVRQIIMKDIGPKGNIGNINWQELAEHWSEP